MQALLAPAFKSIVLGGIGIAFTIGIGHRTDHRTSHRLALHAIAEENAIYLTAFERGDVHVSYDTSELPSIVFNTRASVSDGCRWLGTETLVPVNEHEFAYAYDETILECDPGSTPARKTPRIGTVTVDD